MESKRRSIIGDNILAKRIEKGMKLLELSKKTGISAYTLKMYEIGESNIYYFDLLKIAEALDTDVDLLLKEENENDKEA